MKPRILVVEDERAIRLALKGLLTREGYEVELADSGERAIELLRDGAFDLVLTDLALGRGASGMDVLKRSKESRPVFPERSDTAKSTLRAATPIPAVHQNNEKSTSDRSQTTGIIPER